MVRDVNGGPGIRAPVQRVEPGPVYQYPKPVWRSIIHISFENGVIFRGLIIDIVCGVWNWRIQSSLTHQPGPNWANTTRLLRWGQRPLGLSRDRRTGKGVTDHLYLTRKPMTMFELGLSAHYWIRYGLFVNMIFPLRLVVYWLCISWL